MLNRGTDSTKDKQKSDEETWNPPRNQLQPLQEILQASHIMKVRR